MGCMSPRCFSKAPAAGAFSGLQPDVQSSDRPKRPIGPMRSPTQCPIDRLGRPKRTKKKGLMRRAPTAQPPRPHTLDLTLDTMLDMNSV